MSPQRRTLFLGDLPIFCTEQDLDDLFSQYGEIYEIRLKKDPNTHRNLSYGFVKFVLPACATIAKQELNRYLLHGRAIRIEWASKAANDGGENESSHGINISQNNSIQIHVSYMSRQKNGIVNENSLRSLFSPYGEVLDVSIKQSTAIRDTSSKQSGYGFVHFPNTPAGVQSALAAVEAFNNVTVDEVTYDCHLSHRFTGRSAPLGGSNNMNKSVSIVSCSSNESINVPLQCNSFDSMEGIISSHDSSGVGGVGGGSGYHAYRPAPITTHGSSFYGQTPLSIPAPMRQPGMYVPDIASPYHGVSPLAANYAYSPVYIQGQAVYPYALRSSQRGYMGGHIGEQQQPVYAPQQQHQQQMVMSGGYPRETAPRYQMTPPVMQTQQYCAPQPQVSGGLQRTVSYYPVAAGAQGETVFVNAPPRMSQAPAGMVYRANPPQAPEPIQYHSYGTMPVTQPALHQQYRGTPQYQQHPQQQLPQGYPLSPVSSVAAPGGGGVYAVSPMNVDGPAYTQQYPLPPAPQQQQQQYGHSHPQSRRHYHTDPSAESQHRNMHYRGASRVEHPPPATTTTAAAAAAAISAATTTTNSDSV